LTIDEVSPLKKEGKQENKLGDFLHSLVFSFI